MKKRIYVALIAIMLVMSMALVSCDLSSYNISLGEGMEDITGNDTEKESKDENEDPILEKLNDQTPFEVYSSFGKKLDVIKGNCTITSTSKLNTDMVILGQNINAVTEITTVVSTHGKNTYSKSTTSTNASGTNIETVMETWYVDGVIYTTDGTQKLKLEVTEEEARELVYGEDAGESSIIDIPESWFNGVKFEKLKNNNYRMEIDMSGDKMEEAIKRLGIAGEAGFEMSDIQYEYEVDKSGNMIACEAKYTMELKDSASMYSASSDGTISTVYSHVGKTDKITVPEDADTYTVVTLAELREAIGK